MTIGAIPLSPYSNIQVVYKLLNFYTVNITYQFMWTLLPMTNEVIDRITQQSRSEDQ